MHSKGRAISHKSSNWSRTTTTIQAHAVHSVMDDLFRTIFFGDQDHRNTNLFLIRNGKIGKFFIWNQSIPILPSLVLLKSCKINCPWLNSQKCKPIFFGFSWLLTQFFVVDKKTMTTSAKRRPTRWLSSLNSGLAQDWSWRWVTWLPNGLVIGDHRTSKEHLTVKIPAVLPNKSYKERRINNNNKRLWNS